MAKSLREGPGEIWVGMSFIIEKEEEGAKYSTL